MSQGGVPGGGVVKLIKQIPSVECKFHDFPLVTGTFAGGWSDISTDVAANTSPFSIIMQSAAFNGRIGRKIRVIGVIVRALVESAGAPMSFDLVRDKQCNGVAATVAQVYTTPADPASFPNPFEETRFQYLKRIENKNVALAANAQGQYLVSFQVKCSITVEYNNATTLITDLSSDNLTLFACSCSTGGPQKIAAGQIRVLYVDA